MKTSGWACEDLNLGPLPYQGSRSMEQDSDSAGLTCDENQAGRQGFAFISPCYPARPRDDLGTFPRAGTHRLIILSAVDHPLWSELGLFDGWQDDLCAPAPAPGRVLARPRLQSCRRGYVGEMTDRRDLLAAIGEVVVNSASLEYAVAVLVAVTERQRDEAAENRALAIVRETGKAVKELKRISREHPDRDDLKLALQGVTAVLNDRHILAHSIALEDAESGELPAMVIYNARARAETSVDLSQVREHVRDIRTAYERVHALIAATTAS